MSQVLCSVDSLASCAVCCKAGRGDAELQLDRRDRGRGAARAGTFLPRLPVKPVTGPGREGSWGSSCLQSVMALLDRQTRSAQYLPYNVSTVK